MSFAYFPFYTGDYYRDTRHLSMLQHGAYRQLLDHCWDQKGPLPIELDKCFRICGAVNKEEQDCVKGIIEEFFVRMPDGFYQKRVQEEIERANVLSGKRADAAHNRWKARKSLNDIAAARDASAMQVHSKSIASAPSPSPSPSPYQPKEKNQNTRASREPASPALGVSELVELGVDRQHAADWLKARGKMPLTATALAGVKREAAKAGITIAAAVQQSAERGWRGFRADWYAKEPAAYDPFAGGL